MSDCFVMLLPVFVSVIPPLDGITMEQLAFKVVFKYTVENTFHYEWFIFANLHQYTDFKKLRVFTSKQTNKNYTYTNSIWKRVNIYLIIQQKTARYGSHKSEGAYSLFVLWIMLIVNGMLNR